MKPRLAGIALASLSALFPFAQAPALGGTMPASRSIIDFSHDDRSEWYVVNDGVMGGLSQSSIRGTEEGTGIFSGKLSLENNGGFASVRAKLGRQDLSEYMGLEIRVRGDGRTYQLRLRTDDGFDGISYRTTFETRDGEWFTAQLPFADFLPTFRGRVLRDVSALDTTAIHQLSLMLADKQPGGFALEVDFVRAVQFE